MQHDSHVWTYRFHRWRYVIGALKFIGGLFVLLLFSTAATCHQFERLEHRRRRH